MVNQPSSDEIIGFQTSEFAIDDLHILDAKYEMVRACGILPPAKGTHPYPTYLALDGPLPIVNRSKDGLKFSP